MDLVIYGAQGIALGAYHAIRGLFPEKKILCFLVTKMGNNAAVLGEIPVQQLKDFSSGLDAEEKEAIQVLIGTPESVMSEIEDNLRREGFFHYKRLDSMTWARLQKMAFLKSLQFIPMEVYPSGDILPRIEVYMAKCWKDKALHNEENLPDYLIPIQAGAANTDTRVAELLDHIGDNLSSKNGNYSELTVLYWIWKNRILMDEDSEQHYYGLAHYRRFLMMNDADLARMKKNDIDVVLPYPMPYEPDISVHPRRYLSSQEWEGVLEVLEEREPEYAYAFNRILGQKYMYNYNIIVAKGTVLADYCDWLFPVLFCIEEKNNPDGTKEANRYLGYVGEILETLYFMYNRPGLKVAHTGCRFLL